jgi:uncharacterized protein (TIGR02147 family)
VVAGYRLYNQHMIFEHNDYRTFLKNALHEKSKEREGYSLRAFAEKLHISNSYLSEVLNSKKAFSVDLAFKVALKLDLTDLETQYFCLLVQIDQEKDPSFREEFQKRLNDLNPKRKSHDLSVDLFKTISEWYHLPILELTYLPGFKGTPEYVAKKLGISKPEAELALKRLLRLELIEKDAKGKWRKAHNYLLSESSVPNSAFKQYHKQFLTKALESIDNQSPQERISATDVIAVDSKYLPEVDRLSQEFSAAVMRISEKSKIKDSVYALSVHFINLTKSQEK